MEWILGLVAIVLIVILFVKFNDQARQMVAIKAKLIQLESQFLSLQTKKQASHDDLGSVQVPDVQEHSKEQIQHEVDDHNQHMSPAADQQDIEQVDNNSNYSEKTAHQTIKADAEEALSANKNKVKQEDGPDLIERFMAKNGLLWLGALILALGGVFLAKYAIEANMLPPSVRLISGAIFGFVLLFYANFLHTKPEKYNINTPLISAALGAGGLITLYAMILVAFSFYEFLSPLLAFALLSIVSLASTGLALRFGPLLALIGMIGAYAVPALVNTGSNNALGLMLFITLVSFANVFLAQKVQRDWLRYSSLVGHFIWMTIALLMLKSNEEYIYAGFLLVSAYLFCFSHILGWSLSQSYSKALSLKDVLLPTNNRAGLVISILLLFLVAVIHFDQQEMVISSVVFALLAFALSYRHSAFDAVPYLAAAFAMLTMQNLTLRFDELDSGTFFSGQLLYAQIATISGLIALYALIRTYPQRHAFHLLLFLCPLIFHGVAYASLPTDIHQALYYFWSVELLVIAAIGIILIRRSTTGEEALALCLTANVCVTLVLTMLLNASVLTLALAMQISAAVILSQKFAVKIPAWLLKIALMIVIARLSLAPWIPDYANQEILGLHFSIVIYPVVIAVLFISLKFMQKGNLNVWFEGALLHLIALFILTETSIFLTGDYPDPFNLNYKSMVLVAFNWLVLGCVYYWRASQAKQTAVIYKVAAYGLWILVLLIHSYVSVVRNPFINSVDVGQWPVINWTTLQWALPAVFILVIATKLRFLDGIYRKLGLVLSAGFGFLWVNANIRLGFHDKVIIKFTAEAEVYTYSLVWMSISVGFILLARYLKHQILMRMGFVMMLAVVLKAFLIDASELQGLYRALSFIILGLVLVALGWLFQRIKRNLTDQSLTTA